MKIEEVFSSRGRVRILRVLAEMGELNISALARRAKLNYSTANEHLGVLEQAGLVRHKRFGRIRIFRFNDGDERARAIRQLVETWEKKE
ncbi:ArsR family transcriptional regulator [Candidatus Bathyarchaeota archaeon]|nr:winged helix-turn-helix transcriptional regulator [Candidatus Bathyarchaeota archaeon]NIU80991.1 ArsR family transcriptional regulator [Candidatus Bathyarchaeota archaeon]NIV67636.1 ArsR family transcriptional regulator [Candidatus Bathyarchaeota archaeon]NIW16171.1 ArsR family transcriptional regulator [Candidatus Bathyarchaeota archaeon]NIW34257.1 ArsR family transcriptional regulator [Candidatus Bathyarchaeota archaeon]